MRAISTLSKLPSALLFPRIKLNFSQQPRGNGNIPKVYQDWQYCKMITHELKTNNLTQSLSLLFQSYFNNKILDIQIYNQIHQKIVQTNASLSYAEIVYSIYREHFPPHPLMTNWMHKLTYSTNQQLIEKLKKDYEVLGLTFPQRSPRAIKRQAKKQIKVQPTQEHIIKQGGSVSSRRSKAIKKPVASTIPLPNIELPNIQVQKTEEEISHNQQMQQKISSQIRDALNQLSIDMNSFSRIVVHDIEITLNNESDEGDELEESISEQQDQQEQQDDEIQHMGLYGLDINQIKIGRVQFISDKIKDQ